MFVKNRMTRNPIAVPPDTKVDEAISLMKEKKFRRLPIVEDGKLIGIVTDRDLMRVSPSSATTLSKYEINSLLAKIPLSEIMADKVIAANENDPIEEAALLMSLNKIGGLPVVDDNRKLTGIITETDIFNALVEIMGLSEGKTRITIEVDNRVGVVRGIAGIFAENGYNIDSFVTCKKDLGKYDVIIRGNFVNVDEIVGKLKESGYNVTHTSRLKAH